MGEECERYRSDGTFSKVSAQLLFRGAKFSQLAYYNWFENYPNDL